MKTSLNKNPEISFVVCTRNRADYIGPCISQLLAVDTKLKFEVIVRDNFSSDNTPEVVAKFNDSRLRYIRASENQGWSTFLEAGKIATGDVITWISDEDDFVFEHLEYILSTFKTYTDCNVIIGGVTVGPRMTQVKYKDKVFQINHLHEAYLTALTFSGCAGVFVRKTAFDKHCQLSFIDQYDAYAKQNFYQIGFIATCCLARSVLITTSRIVANEVRHAPTTDNWSVAEETPGSNKVLQPHYYPISIYDRLNSSLVTVWKCKYLSFYKKIVLEIKLIQNFIANIHSTTDANVIELLSENYSSSSVNAYKSDLRKRNLNHNLLKKVWIFCRLVAVPFHFASILKRRQHD